MRKGYQDLVTTLRLLATPELAEGLEWISLQTDNGTSWRCDKIKFDPPNNLIGTIQARVIEPDVRDDTGAAWVMIPTDELVGLAFGFGVTAKSTDLPVILDEARAAKKKAAT